MYLNVQKNKIINLLNYLLNKYLGTYITNQIKNSFSKNYQLIYIQQILSADEIYLN